MAIVHRGSPAVKKSIEAFIILLGLGIFSAVAQTVGDIRAGIATLPPPANTLNASLFNFEKGAQTYQDVLNIHDDEASLQEILKRDVIPQISNTPGPVSAADATILEADVLTTYWLWIDIARGYAREAHLFALVTPDVMQQTKSDIQSLLRAVDYLFQGLIDIFPTSQQATLISRKNDIDKSFAYTLTFYP